MLFVACAIIIQENKILVTQRGPKMQHPLKWEFPGGKIEPGEPPEACIIREIKEELQVTISIDTQLHDCIFDGSSFKITLYPFIASIVSGDIQLTEHQNYKWLLPEELSTLDWAVADLGVVAELKRHLSNKSK